MLVLGGLCFLMSEVPLQKDSAEGERAERGDSEEWRGAVGNESPVLFGEWIGWLSRRFCLVEARPTKPPGVRLWRLESPAIIFASSASGWDWIVEPATSKTEPPTLNLTVAEDMAPCYPQGAGGRGSTSQTDRKLPFQIVFEFPEETRFS